MSLDQIPTYLNIRAAYFLAWDNNLKFDFIKDFITDQWLTSHRSEDNPDSIPPNELSDYYAARAVMSIRTHDNKTADSLLNLSQKLRIPLTLTDTCILADHYQARGGLAKAQNDYTTALEYYTEAIRLNQLIHRQGAIAGIHLEATVPSLKTNPANPEILINLQNAIQYFTKDHNDQKLSWAYNEIGNYWFLKKDIRQAIEWFRANADLQKKTGQKDIHAAYNNLSAMYSHLRQNDSILYYMQMALKTVPPDNYSQKAFYLSNLGAIYGGMNLPDSALNCFTRALRLLYPGDPVEKLDFNPNPKSFTQILPTVLSNKANALFELYEYSGDQIQLRQAMNSLDVAIGQFNTIREMSNADNRLVFGTDTRDYYFLALEVAAEVFSSKETPESTDHLIRFSQQSKAAVFNDFQRIMQARNSMNLDPDLIARDDSLKQAIAELNQEYFTAERDQLVSKDLAADINSRIIDAKEELKILTQEIVERYPGYSRSIENQGLVKLEEIRKALDSDEFLLDYTYNKDLLLIIGIDHNQVIIKETKLNDSFAQFVPEYLMLLNEQTGSHFKRLQELAFYFYQLLVNPFEDYITGKDLVIIPDGIIGYLPFDTFVRDSVEPKRKHFNDLDLLLKHHATRYISSFRQMITPLLTNHGPLKVFAFAPFISEPYEDPRQTLSALKGSEHEVRAIARHVWVRAFKNRHATKANFLAESTRQEIIHLATHGLLSSGNPMNNRILFSQSQEDDHLPMYEVVNLPIKANLIVLSACETGTGDLQIGEGIMSLTRGFHNAGTPSLVMSLWPAYDNPSVVIMDAFYRELYQGQKMSHALRQSKLEYLENAQAKTSHPSYWANYQLSGLDTEIELKKPVVRHLYYLIPFILLLGFLLWIGRQRTAARK